MSNAKNEFVRVKSMTFDKVFNKVRCKKCGDIIESKERHDMVWCKCGSIAVDGGSDYTKISGDPINWEILPIIKERTDDEKD